MPRIQTARDLSDLKDRWDALNQMAPRVRRRWTFGGYASLSRSARCAVEAEYLGAPVDLAEGPAPGSPVVAAAVGLALVLAGVGLAWLIHAAA